MTSDNIVGLFGSIPKNPVPEIHRLSSGHHFNSQNTVSVIQNLKILNGSIHTHADKIFLISSCGNGLNASWSGENSLFNNLHVGGVLAEHESTKHACPLG